MLINAGLKNRLIADFQIQSKTGIFVVKNLHQIFYFIADALQIFGHRHGVNQAMGVAVSALLIDKRLLHNGVAHIVNFLVGQPHFTSGVRIIIFFCRKKSSYILRTAVSISAKAGKTSKLS